MHQIIAMTCKTLNTMCIFPASNNDKKFRLNLSKVLIKWDNTLWKPDWSTYELEFLYKFQIVDISMAGA